MPTSYSQRAALTDSMRPPRSFTTPVGEPCPLRQTVANPRQCEDMVDAAMSAFGRVDILVNNPGVATAFPATRETPEQFLSVIDVNLCGAYWAAQACGRVMRPGVPL